MALEVCADCTAAYAVGLAACPHCRSTAREDDMPKITRHGGVSNAAAAEAASEEGTEVPSSPGSSSSTSPAKPASTQKTNGRDRHKRARTAENRSDESRTEEGFAAPSTDGGGRKINGSDNDSSSD